ncbi:O-antigen ligase family protein [Opitutus sp. GAS368]|uniref:O-antigen ligase family protein n=1 Tax=Opitutus sp. GAS368 TaxID=1882749 RepID=UPI000879ECDF|nr:O-antigen ligase family protein [Opitutus sp. GAS368]SDS64395.1 O-antigen ligase [Opitutus sp. GAS368]
MSAADPTHRRRSAGWLEKLVLFHFGSLLVFTTWAFGGQAPWVRQGIAGWGAGGVLLFIVACVRRNKSTGDQPWPALRYLWPLWLYDLLVIISCFNPGFKEQMIAGERSLVMANPIPWLPTAALPGLAWKELWQFNVIVLSCFNLFLVLPGRRFVRGVLFLIGGNAVSLAVFGTFQKLAGAKGLWFGLVASPNSRFFSTFIYHNHWGAFTLLNTAVCLALLFHALRRGGQRDLWHSPVLMGAVVTLLLAASVPLSASRSCTVLIGLLLLGALTHFLLRVVRRQRERHASVLLPVASIVLAALLAATAIAWLGRGAIAQRLEQTTAQLAPGAREVTFGSRLTLYRDTWRMASEKPWFGWGLESYAHVFRVFNTQRTTEIVFWIPFYAEAHNDWLQSLAEVGFVGTGLLALLVLLPLCAIPWRRAGSTVPRYLLTGCGLVLLYAWVEFPFANPAVMLTFCALFYCALRYAQLELQAQREEAGSSHG